MIIPIALLTYNRTDFLKKSILELKRTNTPFPIHIFDDGSTDTEKIELLDVLEKDANYIIHRWEHKGYKAQFLEVMKYFKEQGAPFYVFIEDDAIFSLNWYKWGVSRLLKLLSFGFNVGVFSLYTGHPLLREEVVAHVFRHHTEHFYGTCCLIINPQIIEEYTYQAYDKGWNPDVAIREMSLCKSKFALFVASPTLAQHIGTESLLGAPPHRSGAFLGRDQDAFVL
jgi:glycosyltransferase involved in cell wall biosynthesis